MTATAITVYRFESIDNGNSRWNYRLSAQQPESIYGNSPATGENLGVLVECGEIHPAGTFTPANLAQCRVAHTEDGEAILCYGSYTFTAAEIVSGDAARCGAGTYRSAR